MSAGLTDLEREALRVAWSDCSIRTVLDTKAADQ